MGIEYTLRLAEHGKLSGELLVTGRFEDLMVEAQTKQLVIHSYMAEMDEQVLQVEKLRKKAHRPFPKGSITYYGNPEAIIIPAGFFLAEHDFDIEGEFPKADIISTEGVTLGKMFRFPKGIKPPRGAEAYQIPVEAVKELGPLLEAYKEQYRKTKISVSYMRHAKRRLWLPLYWLRTRKIERARRKLYTASFLGDLDNARELKPELDELVRKLNEDATQSP